MTIQFTNNASTTLASGITAIATSLTVATGAGALFPTPSGAAFFYCTLQNVAGTLREIVKVTARTTDTFTIVRAQDGTSGQIFATSDKVELRVTAADLNNFGQLDTANTWASGQTFVAPVLGTPASGNFSTGTFTWPTFNQNTSGTAAGLSATLAVASGGTGVTTSTGSGANVLATSPTLVTPLLGTPTSGVATNLTGLPLTTGVTGTLGVANGGTNSTVTPTAGGAVYGTGTAHAITAAGTTGQVLTSNGASAPTWATATSGGSAAQAYRQRSIFSGTTYTVPSDVKSFYVFVVGAGGGANSGNGGRGGNGYSEKYYASPTTSYTYAIGSGGVGTAAGGTTTFGGVISVSCAGSVSGNAGSAGGTASGGDFNANGGTGGTGGQNGGSPVGGGGSAGSRAGNGFSGGNGYYNGCSCSYWYNGGGGGTGGAGGNATSVANGATGIAASAKASGATALPWVLLPELFETGLSLSGSTSISLILNTALGFMFTTPASPSQWSNISTSVTAIFVGPLYATSAGSGGSAGNGSQAFITIVELLK